MGISSVSNRWLNRTYKCIAIFLVVFAVSISALRLLLPYAHNYRQDLQHYINETYSSDIIIGSLNMGWQSTGPSLVATNISLLQTDAAEVYIQTFDMNIDFWGSIRHRRLITKDFSLKGVKILFDKTMLSSADATEQNNALLDNVAELFLSQIGQFSVNESQIIYRTDKGQRTFLIDSLHWLNQGKIHQARGSVILDGLTSNNLQLNLHVEGEQIDEMEGTLYLAANQLNITPWLDSVLVIEDEDTYSTVNFNAWLSIEKGQAQKLQVELGQNQIAWQHQENIRTLNIDQGQIIVDNIFNHDQLEIYSSPIKIRSNEHEWQPLSFHVANTANGLQSYISTIEIAGVADLLPLFVEQQTSRELIKQLDPVGTLTDVFFQINDDHISSVAQFEHVNTAYSQGIPGIDNVSGQFIFQDKQIQLNILAENGALNFGEHFKDPIGYQSLSSVVNIDIGENAWFLNAPNVLFTSERLKLKAALGLAAVKDQDVEMSLLATATDGNAIFAETFYPHLLMGEDLVGYLNGALEKGKLEQALVLINGPLAKFPFVDGGGTFIVDAELKDASFKFDQHWPAISHFNANLNFTNNSMLITGRDGLLSGIDVRGVQAAIADLSDQQILSVDANFDKTAPKLVANLMQSSPLSASVGSVLEQVKINENISGEFHLTLPLDNTDAAIAKGKINFIENVIDLQAPEMHFTKVNGSLAFNNQKIDATNLSLLWREMPLRLIVDADEKDVHYQTNINISASWQDSAWQAQLPDLLTKYGQGVLDWQGQLTLNNHFDGSFDYTLDISSDLAKTILALPAPFNKSNNDIMLAKIKVSGDEDQSVIDAKIGQQLNFYGNLNHQQVAFSQAHLILGNEQMYLPLSGFHITTNLVAAEFSQWQPLVSDILNSLPENDEIEGLHTTSLLEQPERIRGYVATVNFFDESLHGVSFNLEDKLSWWLLELTSKEARGEVKFFPDWLTQGLEVNADFIHLNPDKQLFSSDKNLTENPKQPRSDNSQPIFDLHANDELFSQIPPMRVTCESCSYGNLNLGRMTFQLDRTQPYLLSLNNFIAERKNNKLNLNATWQHDQQQSITQLVGEINSEDIEQELERLGFPSTVRDSGLKSSFDIQWQGGLHDFTVATLNGDVKGELDEGYLAEVPDQARAFSILSLQSLVRKLKFDFRDIFSDGMFYSEIKGDFQIKNGVIYTKNTFLKGAAGDLAVNGNTDLNTEILDYRMSYKPNVTSSLPAIAWIATLNPVTFLAGIAIDEVITSKVVSEYKIEVTGSIDEPKIREVDRKTQNISVGRDSPPQIVENLPEESPTKLGTINPETGLLEIKDQQPDKTDG